MPTDPAIQRIFLVGCPRSGTTLLQALLACHPDILALPETHFFVDVVGMGAFRCHGQVPRTPRKLVGLARQWLWVHRGLAVGDGAKRLSRLADKLGAPSPAKCAPTSPRVQDHADSFTRFLDALARDRRKSCWVDKSPNHVFYIDEIERAVPEAKFLHILRDGREVVASLVDAMAKYPDWAGRYRGLTGCVSAWNRATRASLKRVGSAHHFLVSYEHLCEDAPRVMGRVLHFLGLDPQGYSLEGFEEASQHVVYDYEVWKEGVKTGPVVRSSKFQNLFTPQQQARIERRLRARGRVPHDV